MVRAITCAENDLVVLPALLYGTADATLGVGEALERIVAALCEKFPHILIRLRADSGYAKPWFYRLCERVGVEYSIGIGMNYVLKRNSDGLLAGAVENYETTGVAQRLFTGFNYQAGTWCEPRWVLVECEANAQGTNGRAVPTVLELAHCRRARTTNTANEVEVRTSTKN